MKKNLAEYISFLNLVYNEYCHDLCHAELCVIGDFNCKIKRTLTDLRLQILYSFISDNNSTFGTTDLKQRRYLTFHFKNNNVFKNIGSLSV